MKVYTTPGTEEQRRYSPPRCNGIIHSPVIGHPEPDLISTSFVERQNWYNWGRWHMTLRTTPAQAAGLTSTWRDAAWLVRMIDDLAPAPKKPGPPKGSGGRPRKVRS